SRTANPTSQGASLRGIGGSGASRALVLDDGVPLNDPFGGWIFWGRIPRASLDRIEVVRGGASDVYGSGAMGGVVQFIRRKDDFALDLDGGSQRTAATSLFLPFALGNISAVSRSESTKTTTIIIKHFPRSRRIVPRSV